VDCISLMQFVGVFRVGCIIPTFYHNKM
jgi:hypothetical protein